MSSIILDCFDIWTDARGLRSNTRIKSVENISLEGINRLREFILELSIRGELMLHNSKDESTEKLLLEIAEKKQALTLGNNLDIENSPPEINSHEIEFKIPKNWKWTRLQEICEYIQRGKSPKYSDQGSVIVISQKCVQWSGLNLSYGKYIDDDSLSGYQYERYLQKKDILWNSTGTGTVGRAAVIENEIDKKLVADSHVTVIRPLLVDSNYLKNYISSPTVQKRIEPDVAHSLVSGTTNQVELNRRAVLSLPIPLPPLQEQKRIVSKVNELMALCDQLEQKQYIHLISHQVLTKTLVETLTRARNDKDLQSAWLGISEEFDSVFCTEDSIDQLKEIIFQLAILGRLAEQDQKDGPALKLLKTLEKEKKTLIEKGEIKSGRALMTIVDGEKPYGLPTGWEWTKLGNISADIHYGYTASANSQSKEVRLLRISDIQNDEVNWETVPGCEISKQHISHYLLKNGDILIARTGGTIGKSYLVSNLAVRSVFASYLIRVKRLPSTYPEYIKIFLKSKLYWDQLYESSMGTGQPNVNGNALKNLLLPLPPLAEQKRIVAKVDKLISFCENIKAEVLKSDETKHLLSKTILENAFT